MSFRLATDDYRFVFKARDVVRRLARDLVDWTRIVKSQEWLSEHVQELPFTHAGGAWNDEIGEPLPMVVGLPIEMIDRPAGSEIDATFVAALPAKLLEATPLPALLLADARFFARRTGEVERQRAVLLAAIATELKVKQVLCNVTPEKAAFVDIIVDSPRDVSVAAVALFDKTLQAAIGHSLRDEEKDLFKRIGRLFELRNQIAHSGLIPDLQEARLVVNSAREVSDWLDTVHPAKAALLPDESKSAGTSI